MEDSVAFEDEEKRDSDTYWQMGVRSTGSFDTSASRAVIQQQNLQILHEKEIPSQRQVIPATLHEKLSYYRAFVTSPSKTQVISIQKMDFNRFLWYYIFNVLCKSLPSTYVYVFLSCYAPEEHFFISKMLPICYGCIWSSILSAFIGLVVYSEYVTILWFYAINGVIYKNPWNRCDEKVLDFRNLTVVCYNAIEFAEIIRNKSVVFKSFAYKMSGTDEVFQISQIWFYVRSTKSPEMFVALCMMIWVTAGLFHKQLFKKHIWKILNYTQWTVNCILLATFTHLVIYYFKFGFGRVELQIPEKTSHVWQIDIDMLAESMTGPPIVHILTARGTQKVKPSRHSSVIIASNALYYVFRGLLAFMMKRYCETMTGVSVQITEFNSFSFFFLWPNYFSYFYLGDFYSIAFFCLNAIMEFLVIMITFSCLVEAIVTEWVWLSRWFVICILCVMVNVFYYYVRQILCNVIYIFCTSVATLGEAIALYCLYPLGRLVDDITFHYGVPPTPLRIFNLRLVPVFYTIKYITMIKGFLNILHHVHYENRCPFYLEIVYCVSLGPFLLGAIYAIFDIVIRKKEKWTQLFVPRPHWGPKDFYIRQLRKQYDSREYIDSQAPRELSRYFIEKSELETYKLDIKYEGSHTTLKSELHVEKEKKSN